MCMITFVPANVEIPFEGIYNGAITNDDGHGWAVASSKFGLQVGKSLKFEDALKDFAVARVEHGEDSIGLFHSRFGTHGSVNEANIHPFYVKDKHTVVAHNGILPAKWHPSMMDDRSDTRVFVEEVMPEYLTPNGVPSRRGCKRLGQMIGSGNKLAILSVESGKPKARIVNAYMGEHANGVWYSNTGYLSWRSRWSVGSYRSGGTYEGGTVTTFGRTGCSTGPKAITAGPSVEEADSVVEFEGEYYLTSPCEFCMRTGYVNADTMVCSSCSTCNDCFLNSKHCECLGTGRINQETSMFAEVQATLAGEDGVERLESPWPVYPSEQTLGGWGIG